MGQSLGFFAGLSLGINGGGFDDKNINLSSLLPEDQARLIQLLNHHHRLFENLDNICHKSGLKTSLNQIEHLREQYARLYAQFHQKISQQKSILSTQQNLAERYDTLFNKYDQKLRNPSLTNRRRTRYQKLWIQYGMLYAQYCQK